jgi:hypothetical protein
LAAGWDIRPNATSHACAVRQPSTSDRSRTSNEATTDAITALSWLNAVNNAGNAARTRSSGNPTTSVPANSSRLTCRSCTASPERMY